MATEPADSSLKRGPPRRSCKDAPPQSKFQRTDTLKWQMSYLVVRYPCLCAASLHQRLDTCGYANSVHAHFTTACSQDTKQPWTPLSAVRRCLAAAERNSRSNMLVRPALHEMIQKIVPSVRDTVLHGTNNSFALVGPHGCGKSLVWPTTIMAMLVMLLSCTRHGQGVHNR
jgi:hypothetical protein